MLNELQVLEQNVIVAAFRKEGGTNELFERIAKEVRSHIPDVTTKKGRDAIGSLAMKVSKSKTLIEKCGKELVAEQKAQIKLIDDDRILIAKKFDALRDEILAPREAYEQAEKDRIAKHQAVIRAIRSLHDEYTLNKKIYEIKGYIFDLENMEIDSSFEEFEQEAKIAKLETLEKLRTALVARGKYEAEQAELERLRQAEIKRQQKERDEAIARQAAEKARVEAENKAKAEREQAEKLARESAEREARLKAEKEAAELREAQLKQQAIEQAKQAEIKEKQAIEAERKRIEDEQAAQLKAQQEAEAARLANEDHRKKICNEALGGLINLGLDAEKAKAVLNAINKGLVPNVTLNF